jgi:hypothetical protein
MRLYLICPHDVAEFFPVFPKLAVIGPDDADIASLWAAFRREMGFGMTEKECDTESKQENGVIDWTRYNALVSNARTMTEIAWEQLRQGNFVTATSPTDVAISALFGEWLVGKHNFQATPASIFVDLSL